MDKNNDETLHFITDEGERINIDAFVIEESKSEAYEYFGHEESEDETIARHLRKVNRIWLGYPEPHFVLPNVGSKNGALPPYVLTAWLSWNGEKIVVVVFVDNHPDKTVREMFQMSLHQIDFDVLAGIDQEGERRNFFDWCDRR